MTGYAITFARSARKELETLPRNSVARIIGKIEVLATAPRPAGCRKLQGAGELYRIRVGDYRVIYTVDDAKRVVDITAVRHRSEVYR